MDQSFQTLLLTGKYPSGDFTATATATGHFPSSFTPSDDPFLHQQITYLTHQYETSLLSSLIYPCISSFSPFTGNINQTANSSEISTEYCFQNEQKFKRLKTEPSTDSFFNFIPTVPTTSFHRLPPLQSLEKKLDPEEMRLKLKQKFYNPNLLNQSPNANYFTPAPVLQPPRRVPNLSARETAYKRRQTISEKTRTLQKLLPMDRKMDMATVYEEACKYIKFLKAQISVLETMPVSSTTGSNFRSENPRYGGLGELNRQQVLEMIVNSPAAQSALCTNGCCVYSLEQLMMFNGIV